MAATSYYQNLAKLGRVKLPSGTEYALIDYNGRELIAPIFSVESSYETGDYVIYNDELYRFTADKTAGDWDSTKVEGPLTVGGELIKLEKAIAGGVHYRGKTSTKLYDGSTAASIVINGTTYVPEAGDMVIVDRSAVSINYATATAYSKNTYIKKSGETGYWITNADISAGENTEWSAVEGKMDLLKNDPEFLYDGSVWNSIGSIEGLGDLAFKDTAEGTYTAPTGSGSVSVNDYSASNSKLVTATITGTNGTVDASKVTGGEEKDIAKVGTAVRYGTADVAATATPVASVGAAVVYGTADVGASINVGTSLTGTTTFNTNAIKSASLTGTTTFNTNAIKSASLTGTTTYATSGVVASASGDCLIFTAAGTASVGISTTVADSSSVGISTVDADSSSVSLGTTSITPAAAAPSSQTLNKVTSVNIYQAVAAPNSQTLTPAESNGKLKGSYTISAVSPAAAATQSQTFATGALDANGSGASVTTGFSASASTKTVTVGVNPSAHVVVR